MGLFSSKKTYYTSGVSREPLTDEYPDPYKMSIIQAVVNGGDLVDALKSANKASFNHNTDRYMQYGENVFDYKLPTSSKTYGEINTENLLSVLETVAGQPVTIQRQELDLAISGIGYAYSVEYLHTLEVEDLQHRLDVAGNLITTVTDAVDVLRLSLLGVTYSVDSATTLAKYQTILASAEQEGTISSVDRTAIYDVILASTTIVDQPTTDIANLAAYNAVPSYNNIEEVTSAYVLLQEETVPVHEFYYEIKDNTYPILGNTLDLSDRYLPVVPIKQYGSYINPNSSLYKTGDTLLGRLGLSTKDFKDAVNNSGIASTDVRDTFFAFTVDVKSKDPSTLKYLFELWEREAIANSITPRVASTLHPPYLQGSYQSQGLQGFYIPNFQQVFIPASPPPLLSIDIVENTYDSHIQYSGITSYTRNNRKIGKIGDVISYISHLPEGRAEVSQNFFGSIITVPYNRDYITYEKQVTENSTVCVRVQGLQNTTTVKGRRFMDVLATLSNGESLYLPVNYDLIQEFSIRDKSEILIRAMSLILYWQHVQVVKTGFFGSTFFKILSFAIKVVMVVYGLQQFAGFISGISSGAISAIEAITTAATNALISAGLDIILGKLAEVGGIFAVVAAVFMMYKFDIAGFASSLSESVMPLAEQLMKAVTLVSYTMAEALGDSVALGYELLVSETERFLLSAKDMQEELDKAKDLLGDIDNMYNPLLLRYSTDHFVSTESPTAFYNRSLNTNPGVAALSYISSYTDISLSLPEWNGVQQTEIDPDNL